MSRSLLIVAPSRGFGGGIERVADLVEACWEGPVRRLDLYDASRSGRSVGGPQLKAMLALRACVSAAREGPDVVLALHVGLLPAAVMAARLCGRRAALMCMGREVWVPMSKARRTLVRRTSRRLAISAFTADVLARRADVPRSSISVVTLPVAEPFASAARRPRNRPMAVESELRMLTVSRITKDCRYKGHFTVAKCVAKLAARGRAPHWTVVGSGDDLPELLHRCSKLGIGSHVDLRGAVTDEELVHLYDTADIMVLPSVADPDADPPVGEGFGLVYAEAGAYGVPSVASEAGGGSSAFVRDGENGLTVVPGSANALADALELLRADPALRRRLGHNARERVLAHHLPEHFALALHAALR